MRLAAAAAKLFEVTTTRAVRGAPRIAGVRVEKHVARAGAGVRLSFDDADVTSSCRGVGVHAVRLRSARSVPLGAWLCALARKLQSPSKTLSLASVSVFVSCDMVVQASADFCIHDSALDDGPVGGGVDAIAVGKS
jgi:hypothetical protein